MLRFALSLFVLLAPMLAPAMAVGAPTLVNPAAVHCVETGGFYGIRDGANGQVGICLLPDGSEVDAWSYLREARMKETQLANPAAVFCETQGGSYNLADGTCTLANGTVVDAWTHLREAHANRAQIANPAAVYCIEQGGTYRIERGDAGEIGVCTLPDGTEEDAWVLFRAAQTKE